MITPSTLIPISFLIFVLFVSIGAVNGEIKRLREKQNEQSDKLFSLQRQIDQLTDTKPNRSGS